MLRRLSTRLRQCPALLSGASLLRVAPCILLLVYVALDQRRLHPQSNNADDCHQNCVCLLPDNRLTTSRQNRHDDVTVKEDGCASTAGRRGSVAFLNCEQYDCDPCRLNRTLCARLCPGPIITGRSPGCPAVTNESGVPYVKQGPGHWRPADCIARSKIAVVIPYRDRVQHLNEFLAKMVPYFQRQMLDFRIVVVEQKGDLLFNKGRIMNAAFDYVTSSSKENVSTTPAPPEEVDCIVYHDVDMIPERDGPYYGCPFPSTVKHLGAYVKRNDGYSYKLMYPQLVGGVAVFSPATFRKINGYSNLYWGWGGEDDDMGFRLMENKVTIYRDQRMPLYYYSMHIHKQRPRENYGEIMRLLGTSRKRWRTDGLNQSVRMYEIVEVHQTPLFARVVVDVGPVPEVWLSKKKKTNPKQTT